MRGGSTMSGKLLLAVGVWILAAATLGVPVAHAQSGNAPVAVLGLDASDGAPAAVANTITDALKQRVSAAKGFKLMPGKDLMEVKLIFSCPDEAPSCMAQAAKSLGVEKLIFGSVKKSAEGYLVTLKMLDASKGRVDAWVAEQIARNQANAPGLRGPVQKWFATLSGVGTTGSIRILADVPGASVLLDGLPVGITTEEALEMGGITSGRHEIVLSKPGYEPVRKDVNVVAGEVANLKTTMDSIAAPPTFTPNDATATPAPGKETPEATDDKAAMKIATWGTLGAGAVSLALGVKFSLDVMGYDSDLDAFRRYDCGDGKGGRPACDSKGGKNIGSLTDAQLQKVAKIQDDAKSPKVLQFVFYGAGAALIGTGIYLYLQTYVSDDAPAGSQTAQAKRLQVTPVVTPDGASLSARLTF
jgi:TolB-like protein